VKNTRRTRLVEEASEPRRLVGRVIGEEISSVLERREGSLKNFWLVALLPLQLVTSNI
jgi:predicted transcriptional regulator